MKKNPSPALCDSIELPCGAVLKNRLAKSPMSDSLGDGEGNPTDAQVRLYEKWAEGGVGLSIIGEVQGDPRFPEKPGNLVLGKHANHQAMRSLASRASINGAHIWPQLGHAGALSHLPVSSPTGPSPLNVEGLQSRGMSLTEIQQLPDIYAQAASYAKKAGFTGVHIHAGHGFLLSQFLSPLFNHRTDGYGGSIEARMRIIQEIIEKTRTAVGPTFPIGIRINATDKLEGGLTEADALEVVRILDRTTIDLIDISGGTYFPGAKASSDGVASGKIYFLEFAKQAKTLTNIPLMLTGGFTKHAQAIETINDGSADIIGLARALALNPKLADNWINGEKSGTSPLC
ncbi:NADH:flavin oxidoreductase/NADH oxidase family protein [Kiloniella sp.]|uniref:NADH:flavin oxidoreductase/NADH oxidase family protein n=1 Tax=Kiloniella sp. TaxID=1938587 RepID=UPI003B012B85